MKGSGSKSSNKKGNYSKKDKSKKVSFAQKPTVMQYEVTKNDKNMARRVKRKATGISATKTRGIVDPGTIERLPEFPMEIALNVERFIESSEAERNPLTKGLCVKNTSRVVHAYRNAGKYVVDVVYEDEHVDPQIAFFTWNQIKTLANLGKSIKEELSDTTSEEYDSPYEQRARKQSAKRKGSIYESKEYSHPRKTRAPEYDKSYLIIDKTLKMMDSLFSEWAHSDFGYSTKLLNHLKKEISDPTFEPENLEKSLERFIEKTKYDHSAFTMNNIVKEVLSTLKEENQSKSKKTKPSKHDDFSHETHASAHVISRNYEDERKEGAYRNPAKRDHRITDEMDRTREREKIHRREEGGRKFLEHDEDEKTRRRIGGNEFRDPGERSREYRRNLTRGEATREREKSHRREEGARELGETNKGRRPHGIIEERRTHHKIMEEKEFRDPDERRRDYRKNLTRGEDTGQREKMHRREEGARELGETNEGRKPHGIIEVRRKDHRPTGKRK